MNNRNDDRLIGLFQAAKVVPEAPNFTNEVMRKLPSKESDLFVKSLFTLLTWCVLGVFIWMLRIDLLKGVESIVSSLVHMKLPDDNMWITYPVFVILVTMVAFQTANFFLQNENERNDL